MIVVGAGAAGCVIAGRLSELRDKTILLLEEGALEESLVTAIPLLTFMAGASADRNWNFNTEGIPALGGRRQIWNQGRGIGGSSSINGMVYMRGHSKEYDRWAGAGCPGWSFDDLLPYFKKSESNSRGSGVWHGGDGPMRVRPSRLSLPICDAFLEAVAGVGYPVVEDLNAGVEEGFGRYDCNIAGGIRMSAAQAYLRPARGRDNLTVIKRARALRVRIEGHRATGVEVLQQGERRFFRAKAEVVVCGGAINSPALLMASGVGPADHLAEVGIEPRVDSPQLGENLRNHPAYFQQYHCTSPVTAHAYLSPLKAARACIEYVSKRTGPIGESFSSIGGFMRSDASLELPDTIVVMVPSLVQRVSRGEPRWRDWLPKENGFLVSVALGRPHSVGRIRVNSGSPGEAPKIFPNYFDDPRDLSALARSVQTMRRAMQRDCILRHLDTSREREAFTTDLSRIETEIRASAGSLSHPSGTCGMGSNPSATVDLELRVKGVMGLRVADNSVIPEPLNACTHAVALMIGEKASELIKRSL